MYPASACRFRRMQPPFRARPAAAVALSAVFLFVVLRFAAASAVYPALAGAIKNLPGIAAAIYLKDSLKILKTAMPVLEWSSDEGDAAGSGPVRAVLAAAGEAVGLGFYSPAALLRSQIPLLSAVDFADPVAAAGPARPHETATPQAVSPLSGDALVCIYNTHTGETYSLTDGVDRVDGRAGGVVAAAAALQEALEVKHKIKTARSDRINDSIYARSYIVSGETAKELLSANPGARVVLDIHRDSGKTREQSVVSVNGRAAAPILFVVGSGARRTFPGWRQNYEFAVLISGRMNEMYPGLSLGVRVEDGIYNQNLHPHAVLVEIGTSKNSTGEAVYSARLLADVLAWYINGDNKV
ncbi:MAG TPA: stage II sporulation protein P [Bacillota bacterium]|mgnify:CR=1 FL=1|nr:stage II sporulation protein P [Bacillota bacterium]